MTDTYTIFFYFRNLEEIQQSEYLNPILQQLVSHGYYLTTEEEWGDVYTSLFGGSSQSGMQGSDNHSTPIAFQPGFSTEAWKRVVHFCQEKTERCELSGFWVADNGPGRGFDFRLTLYNEDPLRGALAFSFDQDFFIPINREEHYEHWLAMLKDVYGVGRFFYVYQLDHMGFHQPGLREDLLTQGVTRLYPLNIFGPELVEQLGRERLLATPTSFITPLDDGGILLVPFRSILPQKRLETDASAVASYLGLVYGEQ